MKKKQAPNKQIAALGAKIKRLEAEKEILNRAIEMADDMFSTDIRKKVLIPVAASFRKPTGGRKYSVRVIASVLGYSRQNVYKQVKGAFQT